VTDIAAVLFDADGVVQTTPPGFRSALGALCGNAARADEFLEQLFAAERPCLTGDADFAVGLSEVLDRWRSPVSVADALRIWEMIEPSEEVLAIAEALRRRAIRVGLATNQQHQRARIMTEVFGYADRFDDLFFSCEMGHAKPSRDYFEQVLAVLNLDGRRVLFIDDHERNVEAARDCGLRAEVFTLERGAAGMLHLLGRHGIRL
jgi:HAD superfamily hydrolase (TIGR01509 family)